MEDWTCTALLQIVATCKKESCVCGT